MSNISSNIQNDSSQNHSGSISTSTTKGRQPRAARRQGVNRYSSANQKFAKANKYFKGVGGGIAVGGAGGGNGGGGVQPPQIAQVGDSAFKQAWELVFMTLTQAGGLPQVVEDLVLRILCSLRADGSQVICVRGTYDHIERVLTSCGLPCKVVGREGLVSAVQAVGAAGGSCIVFCNCGSGGYPTAAINVLRAGLDDGTVRVVVTTDWCSEVFQQLFPDELNQIPRQSGHNSFAPLDLCPGAEGLPYLAGSGSNWWMETGSHLVEIPDGSPCEGLMRAGGASSNGSVHEGDLLALRRVCRRGVAVHFVTHLEQKQAQLTKDWAVADLSRFLRQSEESIGMVLEKIRMSPSQLGALTSSIMTIVGLIVQAFGADHLVPEYRPPTGIMAVPTSMGAGVVRSVGGRGKLDSLRTSLISLCSSLIFGFSKTLDEIKIRQLARRELANSESPAFVLGLAALLRDSGMDQAPRLLLAEVVRHNSSFYSEEHRQAFRIFMRGDKAGCWGNVGLKRKSLRDFVVIHELTRKPNNGGVTKCLQRAFADYWVCLTAKQIRAGTDSNYVSRQHPVSPQALLDELVRGSHVDLTQTGRLYLRRKLPKVESIRTVETEAKGNKKQFREQVTRLMRERKLTVPQLLRSFKEIALASDYVTHDQAVALLRKGRLDRVKPADFLNAILELRSGVVERGWQEETVAKLAQTSYADRFCVICHDSGLDLYTMFKPCGHAVCCPECARACLAESRSCPLCRRSVDSTADGAWAEEYLTQGAQEGAEAEAEAETGAFYDPLVVSRYCHALWEAFRRSSRMSLGLRGNDKLTGRTVLLLDRNAALRSGDVYKRQTSLALMLAVNCQYSRAYQFDGDDLEPVTGCSSAGGGLQLEHLAAGCSDQMRLGNLSSAQLEESWAGMSMDRLVVFSIQSGHYPAVVTWAAKHPETDVVIVDGRGTRSQSLLQLAEAAGANRVRYLPSYMPQIVLRELDSSQGLTAQMNRLLTLE